MRSADLFAARLGLPIRDLDLLEQALTHSSYLHEHRETASGHNERLEFLGDAVVTLVIGEALFRLRPTDDEGVLSARRAAIVSAQGLARIARRIELGEALRLGEGESRRDGRTRVSLLASGFEALVGAIYLDLGYDVVRDWLLEQAQPELSSDAPAVEPEERQEPAPGAHPADERRATVVPARRRQRARSRQALPGRGVGRRPGPGHGGGPLPEVGRDRRRGGRPARPARDGVARERAAPPRLLALRLQGFKSFAERTVVEFGPGISAVVGPNGSGKSNLADALRWALGEQGRALRSRKSEDVIFAGSDRRAALGMADVTLVLDNADGLLPVEYRVLELGRRLYRSGENDYLLNKQRVRLRDLVDLLDSAHLADNAFLFIGQGMVDQALALRPEERRPLFEEVAGVRRHERRRRKAEEQLAEAEVNLARVDDILAELRPQARRLAAQAEQQVTRASAGDELAAALVAAAHGRWHEASTRHVVATDRLSRARAEADRATGELAQAEAAAAALSAALGSAGGCRAGSTRGPRGRPIRPHPAPAPRGAPGLGPGRGRARPGAPPGRAHHGRDGPRPAPPRSRDAGARSRMPTSRRPWPKPSAGWPRRSRKSARCARSARRAATSWRPCAGPRPLGWPSWRPPAGGWSRPIVAPSRSGPTPTGRPPTGPGSRSAGSLRRGLRPRRARPNAGPSPTVRSPATPRTAPTVPPGRPPRRPPRPAREPPPCAGVSTRSAPAWPRRRRAGSPGRRAGSGGRRLDEELQVEPAFRAAVEAALGEVARAYLVGRGAVAGLAAERGTVVVDEVGPAAPDGPDAAFADRLDALGGGVLVDAIRRDPLGPARRVLGQVAWVPDLAGLLELQPHLPAGWSAVTRDGGALAGPIAIALGRAEGPLERRAELDRLEVELATADAEASERGRAAAESGAAAGAARLALDAARANEAEAAAARRAADEAERAAGRAAENAAREAAWQVSQAERAEAEATRLREAVAGLEAAAAGRSAGLEAVVAGQEDRSALGGLGDPGRGPARPARSGRRPARHGRGGPARRRGRRRPSRWRPPPTTSSGSPGRRRTSVPSPSARRPPAPSASRSPSSWPPRPPARPRRWPSSTSCAAPTPPTASSSGRRSPPRPGPGSVCAPPTTGSAQPRSPSSRGGWVSTRSASRSWSSWPASARSGSAPCERRRSTCPSPPTTRS